jgi:hypothetical protein
MNSFLTSLIELFGIIYFRFRLIPRLWCVWLVGVNAACLLFITHIEAQAVLAATVIAVGAQALIYRRIGFTRILGSTHLLWIPLFAWIATRADSIASDQSLAEWILLLLVTNLISLVVDAIDAIRYLAGERAPYYRWRLAD